jgi:putative restriction endonuclease
MNGELNLDAAVRIATFQWLRSQVDLRGDDVLPYDILRQGFLFDGTQVRLMGPQGIFKPAILPEIPLSITTSPNSPYDDDFTEDDRLSYRYRGTDPLHHENVGLRKAFERRTPLVYLHGVEKGRYLAVWPVFIVGDQPSALTFLVAADDASLAEAAAKQTGVFARAGEDESRRAYITGTVKVRLHQRGFRERVLRAYRDQCALCRLRHRDLLDAAHIIGDAEERGEPLVTNGLALCKIHHAAFDRHLIGIRPDYMIQVHPKILAESDGPMLKHGLQGLHDTRLILPRSVGDHPDAERLAKRFKQFRSAA